jgi:hypothetical protein
MQGVEILSTCVVDVGAAFSIDLFIKTLVLILGLGTGMGIYYTIKEKDSGWIAGGIIIGVVVGALIGFVVGLIGLTQPTGQETHYKVTITEEVSMIEFLNKYEIIDQDGKIFTIREKTNESN